MSSPAVLDHMQHAPQPAQKRSFHVVFAQCLFYVCFVGLVAFAIWYLSEQQSFTQVSGSNFHINPSLLALRNNSVFQFGSALELLSGLVLLLNNALPGGKDAPFFGQVLGYAVLLIGFAKDNPPLTVFGAITLVILYLSYKYYYAPNDEKTHLEILITILGVPLASRGVEELLVKLSKTKPENTDRQALLDEIKTHQERENQLFALLAATQNDQKNQKPTTSKKDHPTSGNR